MKGAMTVPELMLRWSCSKFTIYNMIEKKQIKGFKVGVEWRIPVASVEAWENQ